MNMKKISFHSNSTRKHIVFMEKLVIILFLFVVAIGCKKDIYSGMDFIPPIFTDTVCVKAKILNDTIFTKSAWGMASYKDYVVLSANIDDYLLHLYDKNSGLRVKSFAKLGRGPQEVIAIQNFHINEEQGILTAFSQAEKNISIFHLDSIIQNKKHFMDKISLKGYDKMTFFEAYKCHEGFLLYGAKCEPYPQGSRFTLLSEEGKYLVSYDQYPVKSYGKDSLNTRGEWGQLFLSRTMSPDGTKFAEATQIGLILETLNINRNIERICLKGYFKPHYYTEGNKKIFTSKTQYGALYLSSSNKYLYILSYDGDNTPNPIHDIQVFDWNGNPIKKYCIDCYLLNVCPDESKGKLYALAKTYSHELILVSFDL